MRLLLLIVFVPFPPRSLSRSQNIRFYIELAHYEAVVLVFPAQLNKL